MKKLICNLRGWYDTRRSTSATIALLERHRITPVCVFDAGANNSQWTRYLARRYPGAKILSFEPQVTCHPIGTHIRVALSDCEGTGYICGGGTSAVVQPYPTQNPVHISRLDEYEKLLDLPALLKIDCEDHTYAALLGAGDMLRKFSYIVVEVWESLCIPLRNKHATIYNHLWNAGFTNAMTIGAMPWRKHVSQTDVIFWK